MSQRKHDKFILEMKDLIKSLMTFCKPKISIINNEISIFIQDKEGKEICVNQQLITEGHAYVYDGGKKKLFKG